MLLTSIVFQFLHVIGAFQGAILAVMLLSGKGVTNAGRVLGVWCLFMALYFCSPLVIIYSDSSIFSYLIGWGYFIPASFGAFLYLYCRSAIIDKPFHARDILHSLPLLLCLALNLDFLLASPSDKIDLVNSGQREGFVVLATQFVMILQAFVYLGFSAQLIIKCKNRADNNLSSFNPKIFTWLWVLLGMYGAIWLIDTLGALLGGNYFLAMLSDLLFLALIYSISTAQWRYPKLFHIDELISVSANEKQVKAKTETFDSETQKKLLVDIVGFMRDKKPYLDNDLTLDKLARSVGLSSHHLSELLNQEAKKNFYQFVNEYRIEFICKRIVVEQNSKILDLAMAAGFSSKSTFNAVFKQIKGVTPSQFRKTSTR